MNQSTMSGRFTISITNQNGMKNIIVVISEAPYIIICHISQNLSSFIASGVWYVILEKASERKCEKKAIMIVSIIFNGSKKK